METLNVGMYIRTKDGIIDKVIIDYNGHCANPNCKHKHISCAKNYYDEDNVVKASYNIIDILEVGDYVNGYIAEEIKRGYDGKIWIDNGTRGYDEGGEYIIWKRNEDIKSIVTKERFKNMEYRIGE